MSSEKEYIACRHCGAVNYDTGEKIRCRRCESRIYHHKYISYQKTLAFLITAMILFIPANTYPILITQQFGVNEGNTIIGGVISLWEDGSYPIALIILFASVFVPILKFILIIYLLISSKFKIYTKRVDKLKLYHVTELIGSWSMVDVFVVSILGALVQLTNVKIVPGTAATAFALMVLFTLFSALSFDTRLIWESDNEENS
jgi:paraquat-inducible protein A